MELLGKEVKLSSASEEVAGFFAALVGTQYAENPTFVENFFIDFRKTLKQHDPVSISCRHDWLIFQELSH